MSKKEDVLFEHLDYMYGESKFDGIRNDEGVKKFISEFISELLPDSKELIEKLEERVKKTRGGIAYIYESYKLGVK